MSEDDKTIEQVAEESATSEVQIRAMLKRANSRASKSVAATSGASGRQDLEDFIQDDAYRQVSDRIAAGNLDEDNLLHPAPPRP
ncbi:DNA-directed RNA polymerase sigma subunit (sigma70/sigma32) [Arthrobacter bambusae]|uniref:DNA-directed RNA polymerase sigma subunit (Sigma70/sigma32) n=1 Tax=Arthrobacter bambusae TaxID=1338426 RepID=A0ABV2PCH8_9MICC